MNTSNNLGMRYLLGDTIDQVRFWQTIPGEAQRKIFFAKQKRRFYKYLMKFYIIFLAAWAVFAVFYLRRDKSKDAERQRLSDLY
jgi:hypothetical protein